MHGNFGTGGLTVDGVKPGRKRVSDLMRLSAFLLSFHTLCFCFLALICRFARLLCCSSTQQFTSSPVDFFPRFFRFFAFDYLSFQNVIYKHRFDLL